MTDLDVLESLRVQILEARPGDVVVLVGPEHLSLSQATQIRERVSGFLPDGVTAVVTAGITVDSVIRSADLRTGAST